MLFSSLETSGVCRLQGQSLSEAVTIVLSDIYFLMNTFAYLIKGITSSDMLHGARALIVAAKFSVSWKFANPTCRTVYSSSKIVKKEISASTADIFSRDFPLTVAETAGFSNVDNNDKDAIQNSKSGL